MMVFGFMVLAVLIAIDQLSKYAIVLAAQTSPTIPLIEGVFHLTYHQNDGGALGLFGDSNTMMAVLMTAVITVLFILLIQRHIKPALLYWCAIGILAGGIGNLIDRVARGFVVDFFDFRLIGFYIFNFADVLVTCATATAAVYLMLIEPRQAAKAPAGVDGGDAVEPDSITPERVDGDDHGEQRDE